MTEPPSGPPPSVRASLSSSGDPAPEAEEGGSDAAAPGAAEADAPDREGGPRAARPTPVRMAMDAPREEEPPPPRPSRSFTVDGEEWIATAVGRTSAGFDHDARAPLLLLSFARASAPDAVVREGYQVGRELDAVPAQRLEEAFRRSRPWEEEWEGSPLFPGTRKERRGRRRGG